MQTSSQTASSSVHEQTMGARPPRTREELVYQAVTVLAVLLLLGSLWVF
ncbi:MAG: hypothetical protein ABSG51_15425 [Terracidiphilus sp.]|jgi:hypothetical protein